MKPAKGPPFRLLSKLTGNWKLIGEILGLEDYLDEWETVPSKEDRLRNIFGKWKENAMNLEGDKERYPYSWEGLRNILEDAGYSEVAETYFDILEKK